MQQQLQQMQEQMAATQEAVEAQEFTASVGGAVANVICLVVGVIAALALDKFNQSVPKEA